ncbi:MAG: hypothetical protein ACNA78_07985, partial [Balneolaceae bacterium]
RQELIARFVHGEIEGKYPGFISHGVWPRGIKAFYRNRHMVIPIKDPQPVTNLDFLQARPIAMLNLESNRLTKHGEFSPSIDRLDGLQKYPLIAYDEQAGLFYYVFRSDYTVMAFDPDRNQSSVLSGYRPSAMRTRTIAFDFTNPAHFQLAFTKDFNEDRTQLIAVEMVEDDLVVVHQNTSRQFYDARDTRYVNYFGVKYSPTGTEQPREFTLPGKLLGTWGSKLLVEENEDVMAYTIGFYEFVDTD